MKNITFIAAFLFLLSATAQAEIAISESQYICISDSLQAIDSDIYYNLSAEEIDTMLVQPAATGHELSVAAAKNCGVSLAN